MKLAMEQLLQVQMMRVAGKEHVNYFSKEISLPSLQTYLTPYQSTASQTSNGKDSKTCKLEQLKEEACLYAYICSQLDLLTAQLVKSADPRIKLLPKQRMEAAADGIIDILLEQVSETQSEM